MTTPQNILKVERAARSVKLVMVPNPTARELYGTTEMVLDVDATLCRVAKAFRGTCRYVLTPAERYAAVDVLAAREDGLAVN